MKKGKEPRWAILFFMISTAFISMSCWITQQVQRFDCEASGGTWKYDDHFHEFNCINAGPDYIQKYFPNLQENDTYTTGETAIEDDSSLSGTSCDATASLQVSSDITMNETNQYGTRLCEYQLAVTNPSSDTGVWVYFYQHDQDGYAHTEKTRWMGKTLIEPGGSTNWPANVYLYDDQDADGPLMSVPEKLAGVADIPECTDEQQNSDYFDLISVPIQVICPLE